MRLNGHEGANSLQLCRRIQIKTKIKLLRRRRFNAQETFKFNLAFQHSRTEIEQRRPSPPSSPLLIKSWLSEGEVRVRLLIRDGTFELPSGRSTSVTAVRLIVQSDFDQTAGQTDGLTLSCANCGRGTAGLFRKPISFALESPTKVLPASGHPTKRRTPKSD